MTSKHTLFLVITLMPILLPAAEIHDTINSREPAKVAALLRKDPGLLQARNAEGDQPLHLAVQKDDPEMIALLLEAGADVNAKGAKGWTPLHYAGAIDSKEASIALLENGANRDALNDDAQKPEQTARRFTRKVIMDYNPQMAGADQLFTAIESGDAEKVKALIVSNPQLLLAQDGLGRTSLVLAAENHKIELVKLLIEAGAEVNAKGRHTALTKAAEGGHLELVRLLLQHGAEVNPSRPEGPMESMPLRAAAFTVDGTPAAAEAMEAAGDMKLLPDGTPDPASASRMMEKLESLNPQALEGSIPEKMALLIKPQPQPVREAKRTILKQLLEAGADPKKDDQAIIAAAMSSETEMVRLLLEHGANPNAEHKGTGTAVCYAVMIGAPLPLIQMLLTAGADPLRVTNPSLPLGRSALSLAVGSNNKEAVDAILATLKPGELSEARHFEVFHSLMLRDPANVRRALDSGFKVNARGAIGITGLTPLMVAAKSATPEIMAMLLDAGADAKASDDAGFTALHTAAESGRTEQVALLLELGADPEAKTKDGRTALQAACGPGGTEEGVAALLKANAKVNARDHSGRTAVMTAAFFGKPRIVARLLEAGADPNHVNGVECSVLYQAAGGPSQDKLVAPEKGLSGIKQANLGSEQDYLECARLLIKQGAKVNGSTDGKNRLPLYYAASSGFEEMVELLLENGAKADIEAKARRTPILGAVESGIPELLERMIALGAKPDTLVNDIGTTALHAAAALENAQMVEILLKHGAKVNAKSTTGITPLLNAVNFNHVEVVRVLLKNGADPDIAAIDGMTPRALAVQQQRWEITKLLNSTK
jgi:ankyrin repeat protein